MMYCPKCFGAMEENGKYICTTSDYRMQDSGSNLVFVVKEHDIPSSEGEIGSYENNLYYCTSCKYWEKM